jgi:hypothetical protein
MGLKWKTVSAADLAVAFQSADADGKAAGMAMLEVETNIIKDISVKNSPRDDGELEAAHKVVKRANGSNKVTFDVVVGGIVNGVDVDAYASIIHEGITRSGNAMDLGPRSILKQAGQTEIVGEKFLERAFDGRINKTIANILEAVTNGVKKYVG